MRKGTCHHDKLSRLKKIEGQMRGIQKMIEEGRYCVDILNTVGATLGALKKVESLILRDHLEACVKEAFEGESERDKAEKLQEILELMEGFRK